MDVFVIEIKDADNVHMELLREFQKKEISDSEKWNQHCFSYLMVDRILKEFYKLEDREIVFEEKKPVLKSGKKHFSISHSGKYAALAFSDFNCGIDIEEIKQRDFEKISKRMGFVCSNLEEFYKAWTTFEAEYKLAAKAKSNGFYCLDNYSLAVVSENPQEDFELWFDSAR